MSITCVDMCHFYLWTEPEAVSSLNAKLSLDNHLLAALALYLVYRNQSGVNLLI